MSVVSSSPSPSPTPSPGQSSSPSHHSSHQHSTKPGALVSAAKSILSEQSARLSLKHNTDLDLLEDLRIYLKNRCSIERDYSQSLAKLNNSYAKRSSSFLSFVAAEDENCEIKSIYTSWRMYQEEMEKHAKNRLTQFEQLASVCETLKTMRSHKVQVAKKCLDNYLKKMHEEIVNTVNEIDKTRKLYFEEEHLAKQARDKEEKIKKRKTGIFASFTNLQNKKERTSAHREASDIQSTQARNDYLMALAAGNAHLDHYYNQDLINLMLTIDDTILDKCRSYMLNLLKVERDSAQSWWDVIERTSDMVEKTSADYTNSIFLKDPNSSSLTEILLYEFQACENDTIDTISLEHNADIALRNEGQKWFTWFSKECRNLNRLSAQLVRLQALLSEGHKTVDLPGSGQVDIENRIDEIRQQLRKCEISKLKAKARLQLIKNSGAEVEDFISFETQVASEVKQQSLEVDNLNLTSLSRTPSMRSHTEIESKISKNVAENVTTDNQVRPESSSSIEQLDSPDREVLHMGASIESTSPAPTSVAYSVTVNQASWADYDPTQAWDNEPAVTNVAVKTNTYNGYEKSQQKIITSDNDYNIQNQETNEETSFQQNTRENFYDTYHQGPVDGFSLIGKQCFALYTYTAQNEDELSFAEQELLNVVNAADKDWVQAQNKDGEFGYAPASYLQELPSECYTATTGEEVNNAIETYSTKEEYPKSNDQMTMEEATTTATATVTTTTTTATTTETAIEATAASITTAAIIAATTETATIAATSSTIPPQTEQESQVINVQPTEITIAITAEQEDQHQEEEINNDETYVRALYDYVATNKEEISFKAGDLIKIIDDNSDDGWWTGANQEGQVGHFPSMLVSRLEDDDEDDEEEDYDDDDDDDDDDDGREPNLPVPMSINLPPTC